jgi:hypothetical protein
MTTATAKLVTVADVTVPVRLVSESNQREHWAVKRRRRVNQQFATYICLCGAIADVAERSVCRPLTVTLTRIGPRRMDEDNNVGSFKHVQDSVARFFGVDDGDRKAVRWKYAQEIGKPAEVRIHITAAVASGANGGHP